MSLRTALLFQADNFVGREYLHRLRMANRLPTLVASVGRMSQTSLAREITRTGGRWTPPQPSASVPIEHYTSLKDEKLWEAIRANSIDIVIQGGIGILKSEMLNVPNIGFLNVHPGRLPAYRGNNCPEWAIYNREEVYATAHLIDAKIDTGPTICEDLYKIKATWDYCDFRANLYNFCSNVLLRALTILQNSAQNPGAVLTPQDEANAHYWPPMPEEKLAVVKNILANHI